VVVVGNVPSKRTIWVVKIILSAGLPRLLAWRRERRRWDGGGVGRGSVLGKLFSSASRAVGGDGELAESRGSHEDYHHQGAFLLTNCISPLRHAGLHRSFDCLVQGEERRTVEA